MALGRSIEGELDDPQLIYPNEGSMKSLFGSLRPLACSAVFAWSIAAATAVGAAIVVSACLWKMRHQPSPEEETASRLAGLDPDKRRKICAHRNNNIVKYRSAKAAFSCVEIDVVLAPAAGGAAAVYHPPDQNNHGLTLDFLLTNEDLPSGKLWLDVKDLSDENWKRFLEQVSVLVPEERHGDIIIETSWSGSAVNEAAAAFRSRGFLFSYYLPTGDAIECGAKDSITCKELRASVIRTLSAGFSHLSFDANAYEFVQSVRSDLPDAVRLLAWDLSPSWPQTDVFQDVDIYIVKFPGPCST